MKNKKFIKTSFGCVILIISILIFAISCGDVPNEPSDDDKANIITKDKINVIIDKPLLSNVLWKPNQDTLHIENGLAKNENILASVVKGASVSYKSVFDSINVSVKNTEPADFFQTGIKSAEVDESLSTIPEGDIDTTGGIIKAVIKLTAKKGKTFEGGGNTYSCTITVNAKEEDKPRESIEGTLIIEAPDPIAGDLRLTDESMKITSGFAITINSTYSDDNVTKGQVVEGIKNLFHTSKMTVAGYDLTQVDVKMPVGKPEQPIKHDSTIMLVISEIEKNNSDVIINNFTIQVKTIDETPTLLPVKGTLKLNEGNSAWLGSASKSHISFSADAANSEITENADTTQPATVVFTGTFTSKEGGINTHGEIASSMGSKANSGLVQLSGYELRTSAMYGVTYTAQTPDVPIAVGESVVITISGILKGAGNTGDPVQDLKVTINVVE